MHKAETMNHLPTARPDNRWLAVMVAFYGCLLFSGGTFFGFSLFIKPLEVEFGWDRSAVTAAFTLLYLTIALTAPFTGRAVDRFGPKPVMCAGALISASGYGSLCYLTSPYHLYLSHMFIGIGSSAMGIVPSSAMVSARFNKKRGLAIGLMSTGIGLGGLVMPPVVGGYIIPNFGWRMGYSFISIMILTLIPMVLSIAGSRPNPELPPLPTRGTTRADFHPKLRARLLSAAFLLIASAFWTSQFCLSGTIQSQLPHLEDIGFPVATAAMALGGVGLMSAIGKLFFGWLCDRLDPKYAFASGVSLMLIATAMMTFINSGSSLLLVWLYALTFGLGAGSWLPSVSTMVSRYFGMASYGAVFGSMSLVGSLGISTGPLFAGFIFDITGTYKPAFVTFLMIFFLSLLFILALRKPKISPS